MARDVRVSLIGDSRSLERAFNRAATSGGKFGSKMGLLGRAGSAAGDILLKGIKVGSLGAAGAMVYATKIAGDYQQQLNVFQATAGASGKTMKQVGALAKKLGADTKLPATSAKDAAVAMTELSKGGLKVKDVMKAARGTIQLAAAANIDGAQAAEIEANSLQAFGLKGSEAGKIADLLAASANATTGGMEDMGFALEHASSGAHALGIPIKDTVAAIGEMFNAGIKGGTAGAALNVALTRLAKPTTAASKALAKMGVDAFTSSGRFVGLGELTKRFSSATKDMTQQQKLSALATIFGTRGMKAAQIILAGGIGKYNAMKKAVGEAGAAQKLSDARTKGFNGAMQGLRSTLETLAITFGTKLLPKASEFLRFLSKVAGARSLEVAVKVAWKGVTELAGDLRKQISDALFGGTTNTALHGQLRVGRENIVVDKGFAEKFKEAFDKINWSDVGHRIGTAIGKSITIGNEGLNRVLNGITTWISANRGKLADLGAVMLVTLFTTLTDPSFWARHWELALAVALSVGPGKFGRLGGKLIEFMLKPFGKLGGKLGAAAAEAIIELGAKAGDKLGSLKPLDLAGWVIKAAKGVGKAAIGLAGDIVSPLTSRLGKIGTLARIAITTGIIQAITAAGGWAYSFAVGLGGRIVSGTIDGLKGLGAALKNKIEGTLSSVLSKVDVPGFSPPEHAAAHAIGIPLGKGVVLGFVNGVSDLPTKMSSTLRSSLNHAKTVVTQSRSAFATAFGKFGDDAMTAFDAATQKMTDAVGKRFDKLKANAQDTFDRLGKLADDALSKQMAGIDQAGAALTPAEQAMKDLQDARDQQGRTDATNQGASDLTSAQASLTQAQGGTDDQGNALSPADQAAAVTAAQAAIVTAQKEIDDAAFDQRMADLQVQATTERAQRDADTAQQQQYAQNEYDQALLARQNYFDAQNTKWDTQQAKQELDLGAERDRQKNHLELMMTALGKSLAKQPAKWRKSHQALLDMFDNEFGPDFATAGRNLGDAFGDQLKDDLAGTAKTLGEVGTAITKALGINTAPSKPGGKITKLATGGVIEPRRGGTMFIGGDGGEREWVIPESKLGGYAAMGGGDHHDHYHVVAATPVDPRQIATALDWQQRTAGAYA